MKLRGYLRAAFALTLAMESGTNADIPAEIETLGIVKYPMESIRPLTRFNSARERTLTIEELRAYIEYSQAMTLGLRQHARMPHLLTAGQRPAQLMHAKRVDVDLDACTLVLFDEKGKRAKARTHVLPLSEPTRNIAAARLQTHADQVPRCQYLFSQDGHAR